MTHSQTPIPNSAATALVLYLPEASPGLWDAELSAMAADLEDELGAFVTWAGRGPRGMTLEDAEAAARFMGCHSMIVVALQRRAQSSTASDRPAEAVTRRLAVEGRLVWSEWSAPAIAAAYRAVGEPVGAAA